MAYSLNLSKEYRYLLGVSGGSDSMMLLSLCIKEGLDIVVCFVNYKLRESADLEEWAVGYYCQKYGVKLYKDYPVQKDKENFQMWARNARYEFYKEIYDRENCDYLLTGHQMDDHLENYLMSLERGSHGWYYGIPYEGYHHGMKILRPLLKYRKKQTGEYCIENGVPYHDDESNFTDHYTRNRIRHSLIEPADDRQVEKWLKEIEALNAQQQEMLERFEKQYGETVSLEDFRNEENREELLRWLIWQKDRTASYSSEYIADIVNAVLNSKRNGFIPVYNGLEVVHEYGVLYVLEPIEPYSYTFSEIRYFSTDHFELRDSGKKIQGVTLSPADFPVTVRTGMSSDTIELRYGSKKLSRFFIDRKIPRRNRKVWPVMVNRAGEVIFIADIGCDNSHYTIKPNIYVIKLK